MRFDNSGIPWAGAGRAAYASSPHPRLLWGLLSCLLAAALLSMAGVAQGGEAKRFAATTADRKGVEGGPTVPVTECHQVVTVWRSD